MCRKATLLHYSECKFVQPLWKTLWRFLKKLKIDLSYDPATPGHISKKDENFNLKRFVHPNVHSSTFYKKIGLPLLWLNLSLGGLFFLMQLKCNF